MLTGEGHEHLVAAVGATDACEAVVQIAAAKESAGHVADDRTSRGVVLVVGPLELGQVTFDGFIEGRLSRPVRAVNRCGLGDETDRGIATPLFQCGKKAGRFGYQHRPRCNRRCPVGRDRNGTTMQTRSRGWRTAGTVAYCRDSGVLPRQSGNLNPPWVARRYALSIRVA